MGMGPKCGWNLPQEVSKSFQKNSLLRTYRKGCLSPGVNGVDLLPNVEDREVVPVAWVFP